MSVFAWRTPVASRRWAVRGAVPLLRVCGGLDACPEVDLVTWCCMIPERRADSGAGWRAARGQLDRRWRQQRRCPPRHSACRGQRDRRWLERHPPFCRAWRAVNWTDVGPSEVRVDVAARGAVYCTSDWRCDFRVPLAACSAVRRTTVAWRPTILQLSAASGPSRASGAAAVWTRSARVPHECPIIGAPHRLLSKFRNRCTPVHARV